MGTERLYKAAKAAGYALATSNELLGIKSIVTVVRGNDPMLDAPKPLALPPPPVDRSVETGRSAASFFSMFSTWTTSRA